VQNKFIFLPDSDSRIPETGTWVNMSAVDYVIETASAFVIKVSGTSITVRSEKGIDALKKYFLEVGLW
jgi:hypothetical protein